MERLAVVLLTVLSSGGSPRGALSILFILAISLASTTDAKSGIRVQLAINSGEEDPYWLITKPEDIAFIQRSLQHLPPTQPLKDWPALGWRGFRLQDLTKKALPGRVTVFQDTICVLVGDKEQCYFDQHKLETWLETQARHNGLGHFIPSSH